MLRSQLAALTLASFTNNALNNYAFHPCGALPRLRGALPCGFTCTTLYCSTSYPWTQTCRMDGLLAVVEAPSRERSASALLRPRKAVWTCCKIWP
jgi:hypothetical protein